MSVSIDGSGSITGVSTLTPGIEVPNISVGAGGTVITTTSGGLVGINSTSPERRLDVVDSGASGSVIRSRVTTNNGGYLAYEALNSSGTSVFSVTHNGRINLSDNIVFASGQGLDFSATSDGSGTTTSEILDDYEEGTWTPSNGGNATYTIQGGSYVKVGKKVTAWFDIQIGTIGTGSQTTIFGLPYSCANISSAIHPQGHPGCIGYFNGLALNLTSINIRVDPGNSSFYVTGPTAATTTSGSTQNAMTSGTRIVGALIYVSA